MDEALLKIRLEAMGGDNLANLRKLKKEMDSAFAVAIRGTPEHQRLGEGLAYVKNQIAETAKVAETANAKMMRSYFQLGQELRSARMAQLNFSRVLQDAPFGFMAIQNNIEPLLTSLQSLKTEAEAAGVSFKKALVGAMIGPGAAIGVFAMAVPLITSMIDGINKMGESARKSALELASLKKELMMPGGAAEYAGAATKEIERTRGLLAFTRMIPRPLRMLMAAFPGMAMSEAMLGSAQQAETEYLKAGKQYGKMPEMPEVDASLRGYYPMSWKYGGGAISPMRYGNTNAFESMVYGRGDQNPFGTRDWYQMAEKANTPRMTTMGVNPVDFIKPDIGTKFQGLALHMGNQLSSALANGFQRGFAAGENILKSFTDAVLSSLLGIAAQQTSVYAVSGLLSLIPGVGTFSGIAGALGGLFSQGTARPGITSGGGGSVGGQLESINKSINSLNLRVDNVGLSLAVRRGDSTMADRVG